VLVSNGEGEAAEHASHYSSRYTENDPKRDSRHDDGHTGLTTPEPLSLYPSQNLCPEKRIPQCVIEQSRKWAATRGACVTSARALFQTEPCSAYNREQRLGCIVVLKRYMHRLYLNRLRFYDFVERWRIEKPN
jgi:hypothetical protein